jgi:fructokinase
MATLVDLDVRGAPADALAQLDDHAWREALDRAAAAAALNCTRAGADPPDAAELERFRS